MSGLTTRDLATVFTQEADRMDALAQSNAELQRRIVVLEQQNAELAASNANLTSTLNAELEETLARAVVRSSPPAPRRVSTCTVCRLSGHNRSTCPTVAHVPVSF